MLVSETSSSPPTTTTATMSTNSSQYIQPDYLPPLSATLDAKRSPLALLAQTCSQIGADPTPTTTSSSSSSSSQSSVTTATTTSAPSSSAINHANSKPSDAVANTTTKSGKKSAGSANTNETSVNGHETTKSNSKTPPAKHHHPYEFSATKAEEVIHHSKGFKSPKSVNSSGSPPSTATSSSALSTALPPTLTTSTAFDPSSLSAAYRSAPVPPFPGLYSHPYDTLGAFRHPAYSHLAAAYPPVSSLGLSLAGYQQALQSSYAAAAAAAASSTGRKPEVPTTSSSSSASSVCRDPYCTGCPASAPPSSSSTSPTISAPSTVTAAAAAAPPAVTCPAGCTQCDHQKITSSPATSTTTTTSAVAAAAAASRPYVCNWIAADTYCGKRFASSEELLQHLRSHTSLAVPSVTSEQQPSLPSPVSSYSPLQLGPPPPTHSHLLAASSALHRSAYPTPPLSPLSMAARYHPYAAAAAAAAAGKPPTSSPLPSSAVPPPPPPNPLLSLHHPYAHHPGLSAYYSHPYSLYSQRMLGAGVLP